MAHSLYHRDVGRAGRRGQPGHDRNRSGKVAKSVDRQVGRQLGRVPDEHCTSPDPPSGFPNTRRSRASIVACLTRRSSICARSDFSASNSTASSPFPSSLSISSESGEGRSRGDLKRPGVRAEGCGVQTTVTRASACCSEMARPGLSFFLLGAKTGSVATTPASGRSSRKARVIRRWTMTGTRRTAHEQDCCA
jgi:hypothetical protein